MKKLFLLGLAATALVLSTGSAVNKTVEAKQELDASIIIQLTGNPSKLSQESLIRQQNTVLDQIRSYVTSDIRVNERFSTLVNAVSIDINASYVDDVKNLPMVKHVDYNVIHEQQEAVNDDDGIVRIKNALVLDKEKDNYSKTTMNVPDGTSEGEGVLIAILDTGYLLNGQTFDKDGNVVKTNVTHNAFTRLDKSVKVHDNIKSIKDKIDASQGFHGRPDATHSVYFNSKVPFFYDYGGETSERGKIGDEDYDVFTTVSEHGTHVASIAAGNDPLYKGIAPKAQLALMKVFTDYIPSLMDAANGATPSTGAYDVCILKALEDCAVLGVDIINMSLGSTLNDFTPDSIVTQAISILQGRDVFVNVAAGNEGKGVFLNSAYEYWSTDMVETGIISTYSSSEEAMVIAAAQADKQYYDTAFLIGNKIIAFRDQVENYSSSDGDVVYNPERHLADLLVDHPDGEFEWVKIPNWGQAKDYVDLDVEGKIAIADRGGEITFVEKIQAAQSAGAIACGIIDNDPTQTDFNFRMALSGFNPSIPVVSFLFKDKEFIDNSTDHTAKLFANTEAGNPNARTITSFSSEGPTYDLRIKPDISSPGQSILGGIIDSEDSYDYLDGTSMATPNMCGAVAILLSEHMEDNNYRPTLYDRLMSTADPMLDLFGVNYESVRKQGAGLVDVKGALDSKVFLDGTTTTDLRGRAKIELGNADDIKAGKVNLSFTAINESDADITFEAKTYIYRPELAMLNGEDERYEEFKDVKLQATYNKLIATPTQNVTVKANGSTLINLDEYAIPSEELQEIDDNFDFGCYIEGFVVLTADGQEQLNIPFLGYYGDLDSADPVEPFSFEKEEGKIYQSDILNNVIHNWKGLQEADYGSSWYAGYYSGLQDLSLSSVIDNTSNFSKLLDMNGNTVVPVAVNPYTGESTGKDIYVGNNGFTNTMIISQFVNRSVFTNTITLTSKASGKVVLVDHMYDSLFGSYKDDNENEYQWPLYKSHVDVSYWSAGYIAHRAYTLIPLFSYDENKNILANYPDGEYSMKFSYVLPNGSEFEKEYTLHVDSNAPKISKIVNTEEDIYRVYFNKSELSNYVVNGKYANVNYDGSGNCYYDFKASDYENGFGFIEGKDLSSAYAKTLVNFADPLGMTLSNPNLSMLHTFSYKVTDNSETEKDFALSFKKSGSNVLLKGDITVTMKLPEGFTTDKLMVYSISGSGAKMKLERTSFTVAGDYISFTISTSKFRLNCDESNDNTLNLVALQAFSSAYRIELGEEFDINSVTVIGVDAAKGTREILSGYTIDVTNLDTSKVGNYIVTVTYNGLSVDIKVKVVHTEGSSKVVDLEETPNVEVDQDGDRGDPVDPVDPVDPTDPVDPEPQPQPEQKSGGCGGSIIAASALISILSFAGLSLLVLRGKKED